MNIWTFLSEAEFEEDGFDDDTVMTMAEVEDPSHPLDLKSMKEAQLNNKDLIWIVKNHNSGNGKNDTVYTYKTVEDVELVHKKQSNTSTKIETTECVRLVSYRTDTSWWITNDWNYQVSFHLEWIE